MDIDRAVRDQAGDKPLPGDASAQVSVEPEGAVLRPQDLSRADGIGLRGDPAPVASKGVEGVLHNGHRMKLHTARPGLPVGVHIGGAIRLKELITQMRLPEGDMPAPSDPAIAD